MTDVAAILACFRSGQISEDDMVEICRELPEVTRRLIETSKPSPMARAEPKRRRDVLATFPIEATFDVAPYDDGSGPRAQVRYDAKPARMVDDLIWIETSSDSWVAIQYEHADELCAAIQSAATALRSLLGPNAGGAA
jgi:hypothetical protein